MKTLKLIPHINDSTLTGVYDSSSSSLGFALCSSEKEGVVHQLSSFYYCREAVMNDVFNYISNNKVFTTKNTWLLMHKGIGKRYGRSIPLFEQHIRNAIMLVNRYEKRNNWLLSKAYKTNHPQRETHPVYIIKGSRWWLTAPHTFSLYMLLLRISELSRFNKLEKDTTNEEVLKFIKAIDRDSSDYAKTRNPEFWDVLINNRRKIYGKRTAKDTFSVVKEYGGQEGVLKLENGSCGDKEALGKFRELCKEAGIWK